jgi:small multidrug resistance pump
MAWLLLAMAIVSEVIATSALKQSRGFTRLWPSVMVVCFFASAMYLRSLTLQTLPLNVVYAVGSGTGTALMCLVGRYFFKQMLDTAALIGVGLIVGGVVVLRFFSTPLA